MNESFTWPDGRRAALSITFDDGRASQAERAVPLLSSHGLHATFYVKPHAVEERVDAWREAAAGGHEIGNHTDSHPCSGNFPFSRSNALEDYTATRIEEDILAANDKIRRLLGVEPKTFAYPCGQKFVGRGAEVQSYVPIVARHFLIGRGAFDETYNDPGYVDLAQITGVDFDRASFERLQSLIEDAKEAGAWLVLVGHDVGAEARQTVPFETLSRLCEWVSSGSAEIWCGSVLEVGSYVAGMRGGAPTTG